MSLLRTLDPAASATVIAVTPYTMVGTERLTAVVDAVRHIVQHRIEGALVECGVWKGGCAMAMARTLLETGAADRELWLYDTFAGMTPPEEVDRTFQGQGAAQVLARFAPGDPRLACGADEVARNLASTGWPMANTRLVVGPVEETIPGQLPDRIALLRLDTDWYASTRHELEHLFPRLVPGGVLLIDDYGHWEGCRRAVDEYFAAHGVEMLLARTDYTGRMGVRR